jgi:hypothetical protein
LQFCDVPRQDSNLRNTGYDHVNRSSITKLPRLEMFCVALAAHT